MPEKIAKVEEQNPVFTYSTRVHLDSISNHTKSCTRRFFVHSVEKSKIMIYTKKSVIDLLSPIKIVPIIRFDLKFANILRLDRAFKIDMKFYVEEDHFLTCLIFSDNRSKAFAAWIKNLKIIFGNSYTNTISTVWSHFSFQTFVT